MRPEQLLDNSELLFCLQQFASNPISDLVVEPLSSTPCCAPTDDVSEHLLINIGKNRGVNTAAADEGEGTSTQGVCVSEGVHIDSGDNKEIMH
jgi:hypothetical protein